MLWLCLLPKFNDTLIQRLCDIRLHLWFLFKLYHVGFIRFFLYSSQFILYNFKDLLWELWIFVNPAFYKRRRLRLSWLNRFYALILLRLKIRLFGNGLGLRCKLHLIFDYLCTFAFESCRFAFLNWFYSILNNLWRALNANYVLLKHLYSCKWLWELTFIIITTPFLAIAIYLL